MQLRERKGKHTEETITPLPIKTRYQKRKGRKAFDESLVQDEVNDFKKDNLTCNIANDPQAEDAQNQH
jgi:hypothetical protein